MKKAFLNIYNEATKKEIRAGINWYSRARKEAKSIAKATNVPFIKVCGIISALSPFCDWNRNIEDAFNVCQDLRDYKPCTFSNQVKKAWEIYDISDTKEEIEKVLNGNKTKAFFNNLYRADNESVTIDRHIVGILIDNPTKYNLTPKRYRVISSEIKELSSALGHKPLQLQAILWVTYKRIKAEVPF